MKNKIFIIFFSLIFCFIVLSCSGIFNKTKINALTKVSVGDVILTNGYRVPVDYVEEFNWDYYDDDIVLGIIYDIPQDGSYMVMNPESNRYTDGYTYTWCASYYDGECYLPCIDIPYLWRIGYDDSCGIDNWDVMKSELGLFDYDIYLFPVFSYMKDFNDNMSERYKHFTSGWYVPTWSEIKDMDVNIINKICQRIFYRGVITGTYWLSNMYVDNCAKTFYVQSVMEYGETVYKLLEDYDSVIDYNSVIFVRNFEDLDESKICFSLEDYQKSRDDEE